MQCLLYGASRMDANRGHEVEDHEVRGCIEGVGARAIGSPCFLEEALKRRRVFRTPAAAHQKWSIADANAKIVRFEGSLAVLGPDDVAEWRRTRWRRSAHELQSLQWGNVWANARSIASARRSASRKCGEALKLQTQREEELAEGERRFEVLQAEPSCRPTSSAANNPRDRRAVAFTECCPVGSDSRQSHWLATEKILTETSLKQRIDLLMQEVAALKVRVPAPVSWSGAEMALVPVSRTRSVKVSDLIEEADKKRPRVVVVGEPAIQVFRSG